METLISLRTNFIKFLRDYFSSGKLKAAGHGNILRWDEDPKKTRILIRATNIQNPEVLNKTPAILIQRSDIQEAEEYKSLYENATGYDWDTGKTQHTDIMGGEIIFNCLSPNDEEAETLAHIVYSILRMHMRYFRKAYKYRMLRLGGIGKPRIIQYEGEGSQVRVWNCGVIMNVMYHMGFNYKHDTDESVEIEFQFLRPPIHWIEEVDESE